MYLQPGPSGIKSPRLTRPKKKLKTKNDDCVNIPEGGFSRHINDLPNEILIEIFTYLTIPERLKAQKVCNKWYEVTRSEVFWRCVKLADISESLFIEILASLPPCVSHLEFGSEKEVLVLPMSLPELMAQLHRKCPSLNTLILRNMKFVKVHVDATYVIFTSSPQYSKDLLNLAINKLGETAYAILESKLPKEETIGLHDAILPKLKILSLRKIMFNVSHLYSHISATVLPNLSVLDLSYTQSPTSGSSCSLFKPLSSLEELSLGAWWVAADDIFLTYLKKLKILHLEYSSLSYKAVSALKQNSTQLEELYLCHTNIDEIHRTSETSEFFPSLQLLCLKETAVSQKSINEFLTTCPSLKFIDVSHCKKITKTWYDGLCEDFKEKLFFNSNNPGPCNHFLKKFAGNGTS